MMVLKLSLAVRTKNKDSSLRVGQAVAGQIPLKKGFSCKVVMTFVQE